MASSTAPIRVAPGTHRAVQLAALTFGAKVGQRVTMSQVVAAALTVAERHPDELAAALTGQPEGGADDGDD